jgi:hypothetical protein
MMMKIVIKIMIVIIMIIFITMMMIIMICSCDTRRCGYVGIFAARLGAVLKVLCIVTVNSILGH